MSIHFSDESLGQSRKSIESKSGFCLSQKKGVKPLRKLIGTLMTLLVFGALFFVTTVVFLPIFLAAFCVFGLVGLIIFWRVKRKINSFKAAPAGESWEEGRIVDLNPDEVEIK